MRTIIKGILSEVKLLHTQQNAQFYTLTLIEKFIKKDGTVQTIAKKNVNVFDNYLLQKVAALPLGSVVEVEGFLKSEIFIGQDGQAKISQKVSVDRLEHIALAVVPLDAQPQYAATNQVSQSQINQIYQQQPSQSPIIANSPQQTIDLKNL